MVWRSGATYSGQILMNLMDGRGEFTWPNGDVYAGEERQRERVRAAC